MDEPSQELVDEQVYNWVEMHKKSALSFLVLLCLENNTLWSRDIEKYIRQHTGWTVTERGLYRVLSRLQRQGSIEFVAMPTVRTGAERKMYTITTEGRALLVAMKQTLQYLCNL
ncbi:MAG: PadR family transcriptional regulator [Candidatus Saccharimonadales bacterium]